MRKHQRLLGLMILIFLVVLCGHPAEASPWASDSQMDALIQEAQSMIDRQAAYDETSSWTDATKIETLIPTFDLEDQLNGVIINLATEGKMSGYLRVALDPSTGAWDMMEFGYDGEYLIDGHSMQEFSSSDENRLVFSGLLRAYRKEQDRLFSMDRTVDCTDEKAEIEASIQHMYRQVNESGTRLFSSRSALSKEQVVYSNKYVANLWKEGYLPVVMEDFSSEGVCAPTCGVNILKYWHECRGIDALYPASDTTLQQTFQKLYQYMGTTETGTYSRNAYRGLLRYCKEERFTSPAGSEDHPGFDWAWVKRNVDNGNPFYMGADIKHFNGQDGSHAFFAVGYQECSDGNYIRVGTQWDTSFSHFFKTRYADDITSTWYVRWK